VWNEPQLTMFFQPPQERTLPTPALNSMNGPLISLSAVAVRTFDGRLNLL
jgi:hypothetical protein